MAEISPLAKDILRTLDSSPREITIEDLAHSARCSKTAARRALLELEEKGLLRVGQEESE